MRSRRRVTRSSPPLRLPGERDGLSTCELAALTVALLGLAIAAAAYFRTL